MSRGRGKGRASSGDPPQYDEHGYDTNAGETIQPPAGLLGFGESPLDVSFKAGMFSYCIRDGACSEEMRGQINIGS